MKCASVNEQYGLHEVHCHTTRTVKWKPFSEPGQLKYLDKDKNILTIILRKVIMWM